MFETGVSGPIEWAVAGQPLPGEDESGDGWVVADTGGATLVGVIDGLGHGHLAAVAAGQAASVLQDNPAEPLNALFVVPAERRSPWALSIPLKGLWSGSVSAMWPAPWCARRPRARPCGPV